MRRRSIALSCAVLVWFAAALAGYGQALTTNDPDFDLFDMFLSDPRDSDTIIQTAVMDMDTDAAGRLVVAYGVVDGYVGTAWVEVVVRDRDLLTWRHLATITMDSDFGPGTVVKAISLTVGSRLENVGGNNRAFVAVVFEQRGSDYLLFHHGSVRTPWAKATPQEMLLLAARARPVDDPRFMNPSIAVIPTAPSNFTTYIPAVAVAAPGSGANDSVVKLIWMDWFAKPYYGPQIFTIAGQGSRTLDGAYGRPSLTADAINARWGVAVEELTTPPRIHVIAGTPGASPGNQQLVFTSTSQPQHHHPQLRAHEGTVNLSCLGDPFDNGVWELVSYHGAITGQASYLKLPQLATRCRTPGDLDIKRNDLFVAASCWDAASSKFRVTAFQARRTSGPVQATAIEDRPSFPTRQPRMAVAPPGAGVDYFAVGFANSNLFPSLPGGVSGGSSVMIDP